MQLTKYIITSESGKILILEAPSKIEALKKYASNPKFEDQDFIIKKVTCEITWENEVFQYIPIENEK